MARRGAVSRLSGGRGVEEGLTGRGGSVMLLVAMIGNMMRRLLMLPVCVAVMTVSCLPMALGQEDGEGKTPKKTKVEELPAVPASLQEKEFVVPVKLNTRAKVYFIYMSRSTCSICVHEAPKIVEIYKKMKGKAAELVMLNIDSNKDVALKWAKDAKMKFPIVAPGEGRGVPFPYAAGGLLPHMVAVDAEGNKLGEAGGGKVAAFLQDWKKIVRDYEKEARVSAVDAKRNAKKGAAERTDDEEGE